MYRDVARRVGPGVRASIAAAVAVAVLGLAGCAQDVGERFAPQANSTDGWTAEPEVPTVAELTAVLDLTSAQQSALTGPLQAWQAAAGGQNDTGGPNGPGGPGHLGGPRAPAGGEPIGPGGPGDCGPGMTLEPEMTYLESSAAVLDDTQYTTQGLYLSERRMDHMRRGGGLPGLRGPGASQHIVMRLAHDFGLDDARIAELAAAFRTADEAIASAAMAYAAGTIDAAGLRDAAAAARDAFATSAQEILPADAWDGLVAQLTERRTRLAQLRLDRLECAIEHRVAFLTTALELSDEQAAQVNVALTGFVPAWQDLLGGIEDGTRTFDNAVHESALISEQARAAVRALLDASQAERFDAIRHLVPGEVWLVLYV